ncbi:helix-turn-helix domain-containing protein [Halopelagius fulvigenes]|uniref:Helix-turn-helix domain-containing protein n=1 Tax=Halopelagius fulvigenes TaxID=1198324 RepID=A0ABD5U7T8_9EURY
MATVAEFTVPGDSFPLGGIFGQFPRVTVELERIVPTSDAIIPYFWVRGADDAEEDRIEAACAAHPDLRSVELIDEVDGQFLLRVEWNEEHRGVLGAVAATGVNLISGHGSGDRWSFEVRSDERAGVGEFQQYCRDRGIPIELTALHALSEVESRSEYDLTETQRTALLLAHERGYFDSPRRATLAEIAEDLDITRQSLASRLRRGHKRLIENTLVNQ